MDSLDWKNIIGGIIIAIAVQGINSFFSSVKQKAWEEEKSIYQEAIDKETAIQRKYLDSLTTASTRILLLENTIANRDLKIDSLNNRINHINKKHEQEINKLSNSTAGELVDFFSGLNSED